MFEPQGPKATITIPTRHDMTWGDIKAFVEVAGVPNNAKLDIHVDRVANPTPLDSGNPPVLKFSWDIQVQEYPGD